MAEGFINVPDAARYVLRNATLPATLVYGFDAPAVEGLIKADIIVADGKLEAIVAPGAPLDGVAGVDLRGGQVWPTFTDMHTHLDKGHIWPRRANPDGTFMGALDNVGLDREANWTAEDVRARMAFGLRTAYAHGTSFIRTHLDSLSPQHQISWSVFAELRDEWAGRLELQGVALFPFDVMDEPGFFPELCDLLVAHGGVLGGFPQMGPELETQLDRLFSAATEHGLNIDLHVDETADPEAKTLMAIAEAKLRHGFEGSVVVGHCCSLAKQDESYAARVVAKVAEAGLAVVSLPLCNMYLQDRHAGRTPRWRGVTLVHELLAAGVNVSISSDNTRDPFYAYGDLDPVEVFREGVRILHLDHPLDQAAKLITSNPATALGRPEVGRIKAGDRADLVLFNGRTWTEFLSRPQSDRVVLREGKAIDRLLPDYRELDEILGV